MSASSGGGSCSDVISSEERKSASFMNISSSWSRASFVLNPPDLAGLRRNLAGSGRMTSSLPMVPSCVHFNISVSLFVVCLCVCVCVCVWKLLTRMMASSLTSWLTRMAASELSSWYTSPTSSLSSFSDDGNETKQAKNPTKIIIKSNPEIRDQSMTQIPSRTGEHQSISSQQVMDGRSAIEPDNSIEADGR